MNIFRKKPKIEFYNAYPAVQELYPILTSERTSLPWGKKSAESIKNKPYLHGVSTNHNRAHLCTGILNLVRSGFTVRTWHDFIIKTNGDGITFSHRTPVGNIENKTLISSFGPELYADYLTNFPSNTLKTVIKLEPGWFFHLPKDWLLLMLPLDYLEEDRFTCASGLLDPTMTNQINPILYWHKLNDEVLVKAGTPICKILPIPASDYDFVNRHPTDKEIAFTKTQSTVMKMQWKVNKTYLQDVYKKWFYNHD
jgi:hypothetical protein